MIKITNLKSLSLRKNFLWTFSSTLVNGFVQWSIVIIIARYGSPELVGQFSLATGLVLPVFAFLNFHLRVVYVTSPKKNTVFGDYLSLRLCTTIVALLLILLISTVMGYENRLLLVAVSYGFVRGAEAMSDILYAPAQKGERMNLMAISIILRNLVSLLIVFCTITFSGSLVLAIALMSIWEFCIAVFFDYRVALFFADNRLRFQLDRLGGIIHKSYPLGIALGLTILIGSVPRFIVEHFAGIKEVGYFAAIQYFYVASGMVITAINSASIPRLSRYYADGQLGKFHSLLRKLFTIGAVSGVTVTIFFALSGKIILDLFYGAEYAPYSSELVIIIIAASIQYLVAIAASGILAMNKFWKMVLVLSVGTLSIIIFGIVFVARYSTLGAVYSMLVTSVLQLLFILFLLYTASSAQTKSV